MSSDYHLLRAVAAQFAMGAMMGALLVGVVFLADIGGLGAAVAGAAFPGTTLAIVCIAPVLYCGFGAAITGFLFLVSDGVADGRHRAG